MRLHIIAPLLAATLSGSLLVGAADEVSFGENGLLRGQITAIDATGAVTLDAEVASSPLVIRREVLTAVKFSENESELETHAARIGLRNGDSLPCDLIGMDESQVHVRTWFSGEHSIPREDVASIFLGVRPQRLVYSGPDKIASWMENSGWRMEGDTLVADERGSIRRDLRLPKNFILRFRLAWEGIPNFIIDFAEPIAKSKDGGDRYRFSLNSNGIELKRPRPGDGWAPPIYVSGPTPELSAAGEAEFEFRVDREQREVQLYIDGRWVKRGFDVTGDSLPSGTAITVQCIGNHDGPHRLLTLKVYEWDSVTQRHQNEGPGSGPGDSVIDREGQRFSGHIREISGGDSGQVVLENPHSEGGMLKIPREHVSILYLSGGEANPPQEGGLALQLQPTGFLSLRESRFEEDTLVCNHPMIGEMRIDRRALDSLRATDAPAPDEP